VRYTVWSRGRLIGETDLDFIRLIDQQRSGWFHPSVEGERLMLGIATPLPAMRAYLHRESVDVWGNSLVRPEMHGSTIFADLAEAFQRLRSLELELRREDGSIVPTSDIGFQDTERLIDLAELDDENIDEASWNADDELAEPAARDLQLDADVMRDMELLEEDFEEEDDDPFAGWTPDEFREPPNPRYQIHVLLLYDDALLGTP
jgi:hypothetical protein